MPKRPEVVFLGRDRYRQNRLLDWIRVLPLIGLMLWLVPLLWQQEGGEGTSTSRAMIFLFLVWIGLILATFVSARFLKKSAQYQSDVQPSEDD